MSKPTLAVIQPYIFPYIGYFNLLKSCTNFVLYDDVNYIKRGWINRNRVLSSNGQINFSIPLSKQSSNLNINQIRVADLESFIKKFNKTIEQCYSKARYFGNGKEYIDSVFQNEFSTIAELAGNSIKIAAKILDINCTIYESSKRFSHTKGMQRSQRIISIAHELGCSSYVNPINGFTLYDKDYFSLNNIELKFLETLPTPYYQINSKEFVSNLSIIDMFMNLSHEEVKNHLTQFKLV